MELPNPMIIGVPTAPKLTGVEFAINETMTAGNAPIPNPTKSGADNAAGVPKPAAPSMKAENDQAIIIA